MRNNIFIGLDKSNQFNVFKLNARGFSMEQIADIFELDDYFSEHEIGKKGELINYILGNDNISYNSTFVKNAEVVLRYQKNPVFNRISERLRCHSVADFYKFILSVPKLEDFCDTYTNSPHDVKSLNYKRDENGHIILEPKDYLITNIPFRGSREGRWYLLSNRTRTFIKNICVMREAYSELISEQIANQMGIPHATYDLIKMGGLLKIASINILEHGEELLHGHDILPVPSVKDTNYICNSISIILKSQYPSMPKEQIKRIQEDFLKINLFDKIIGNWDRNPENWGLIISSNVKKIRTAPVFDNNRALNTKKFQYDKDMQVNGKSDIITLLEYCLDFFTDRNEFLEFVQSSVRNISVRKAAEDIKMQKGIIVPGEDIIDMDMQIHGRATQVMRHWLETKNFDVNNKTRCD